MDTGVYLVENYTDRTSNTATSYDLTTASPDSVLSGGQGFIALHLSLAFADNTNFVEIGGIRFTIEHDY